MKTHPLPAALLGLVFLACNSVSAAPASSFSGDWPSGASPQEVGTRVAKNFLERKFDFQTNQRRKYVIYPEVCAWYGSLRVAHLTRNAELQKQLRAKFDILLTEEGKKRISPDEHVDYRVFGVVPLELYMQTKEQALLKIGVDLAEAQWAKPTADGITHEARYWIDDMYMIPAVQVQAFRATGEGKYLDRAALAMAAYLDKLQESNGLFHHAKDSPFFWSRGNGWFAAGMAELLSDLPSNHPQRARIMEGYRKMMASLLRFQSPEGLWRQLIDQPDFWLETSGTGMFAFAMITGVKQGWLDAASYGPAARRAWLALVAHLDENANMRDVCVGTNKANKEVGADLEKQRKFYFDRARKTGDFHGNAPVLWCAMAWLK